MNETDWNGLLPPAAVWCGEAQPMAHGERGEPLWPVGRVGSVTRAAGMQVVVTAPARRIQALGIDMEPLAPLPPAVWPQFLARHELETLMSFPVPQRSLIALTCWCLKEALYKALQGKVRLQQLSLTRRHDGWRVEEGSCGDDLMLRSAVKDRWVLAAAWRPA